MINLVGGYAQIFASISGADLCIDLSRGICVLYVELENVMSYLYIYIYKRLSIIQSTFFQISISIILIYSYSQDAEETTYLPLLRGFEVPLVSKALNKVNNWNLEMINRQSA